MIGGGIRATAPGVVRGRRERRVGRLDGAAGRRQEEQQDAPAARQESRRPGRGGAEGPAAPVGPRHSPHQATAYESRRGSAAPQRTPASSILREAHAARAPFPVRPALRLVAAGAERLEGGLGEPALEGDAPREVAMRPERVGERLGREARGLDRALGAHAEDGHVQQDLEHRLELHVAARRPERRHLAPGAEHQRGTGREPRALAGCDGAGVSGVEPTLRAARRHRESRAGNDGRVGRRVARGGRERVALAVDHGRVRRPERGTGCRRRTGARAPGRRGAPAGTPGGGISFQARAGSMSPRRPAAYAGSSRPAAGTETWRGSP